MLMMRLSYSVKKLDGDFELDVFDAGNEMFIRIFYETVNVAVEGYFIVRPNNKS